ncbi:MAG: hypothetical protein HQ522_00625, partial [Bacteroidetes bacterium]|nr:hypothetical protein [Bacteroidota bacterium]
MDSEIDKTIQKVIHGYRTKCADDAKLLEEAIKEGDAVSMYATLMKNFNLPSISTEEKLLHSTRLFYFMGCCLEYNDGIPMLEVLSDWIDNSEKRKAINAVKSQATLCEFLVEKGVDITILADYVAEKEMIEYVLDEEKKSTGVLKRILERKQMTAKQVETPKPNQKQKDGYSAKEWCTILYYSDYKVLRGSEKYDTEIIKSFHTKNELAYALTSFIRNFKVVKSHIEKSEK